MLELHCLQGEPASYCDLSVGLVRPPSVCLSKFTRDFTSGVQINNTSDTSGPPDTSCNQDNGTAYTGDAFVPSLYFMDQVQAYSETERSWRQGGACALSHQPCPHLALGTLDAVNSGAAGEGHMQLCHALSATSHQEIFDGD